MRILSEQIKLTFKINVKSHPWYERRQTCSSGRGREILKWDVQESSPPNFWPSVHVPFYLLSPIISLLLEDICYCLITRTVSRSTVLVGSQGFWQLLGVAALWTVSQLVQSWSSTSLPWACGWVGGCQEFEVRAIPARSSLVPAGTHVCQSLIHWSSCSRSWPPRCRVNVVGLLAYLQDRQWSSWEKRATHWVLLFPSAFPGDAVHTLVSCPQASLPEEKHSRRLCELNLSIMRFSPKSLL